MSRINTIRAKNPKLVEAGRKGGAATSARHGHDHYQRMGQTPPREGSRPRGRPAFDYVIGSDGVVYSGREAVALAHDSRQEHNPAFSNTD
jgi:hypothetical protein